MSIHKIAPPWSCGDFSALAIFLGAGDDTNAGGRNRYHCSYVIHTDGIYYYAENGGTGELDYGGPSNEGLATGTDAAAVIHAAWGNMPNGGRIIVKGDIDLGTTPLLFNLTKYQTGLELIGLGETGTTFTYAGVGYAITVDTTDAAVGYYYLKMQGFYLTCVALTVGRNGISITDIGRTAVLDHIKVYYADTAFQVYNTNEVYFYNCRAVIANTGFYTGPGDPVNGYSNEVTFVNCETIGTINYGYYIYVGNAVRFYGGMASPENGIGLYAYLTWTLDVNGMYFHHFNDTYTCDIKLTGTDANNPCQAVVIENCYFTGGTDILAHANHAIEIEYAKTVKIDTCKSRNHTNAFIYLYDNSQDITVVNPEFEETYLFDSEVLTQTYARFAGTVVEPRRVGFIAVNADADTCDEGDVMVPSGTGIYVHNGGVLNDDNPSAVMYGQAQNKPIVLCMKGITLIEMEAAVTLDDTIVTSNTNTMGETNNAQTDPKKVLGYAAETTGGAGTALTRIL
jgi:hypothetical protein